MNEDMQLIGKTNAESHDLELLLQSPIVKAGKKKAVLQGIFGQSVNELTMHFMNILADKGRESILADICAAFGEAYRQHKGIVSVEITSARALTSDERSGITSSFQSSASGELELTEKIDPSIIGGLRIKMGDKLMDATVAKKLNELQKQVIKN